MGFNSAFKGLKDNNRAIVGRLAPEINSRACLCVLQGPGHNTRCCFSLYRFAGVTNCEPGKNKS